MQRRIVQVLGEAASPPRRPSNPRKRPEMRTFARRFSTIAPALLLFGAALALSSACASSPTAGTASTAQSEPSATAQVDNDARQAGFYRARVGAVDLTVLSDGTVGLDLADGVLLNTKPGELEQRLAEAFQKSPIDASFNTFLLEVGGRTLLIDTGAAANFGPTAGKLSDSLSRAGMRADAISDVFLTHVHPDHSGGLVVDGKRAFPNATLHVEQKELDYWLDDELSSKATGMQASFFAAAKASLRPYLDAGQVKAFSGATEFLPGFSAEPAYGHTPGHVMYALESKGEKLLFWGDLIHVAAVQFDDPGVAISFDVDPAQAVQTRKSALASAADGAYLVAQNHVAFPGIGHIGRTAGSYRWVPIPYVDDSAAKPPPSP
jgi:glyoxylase-like metal-dependent hydrolase (beta-lactamase superfamily II)